MKALGRVGLAILIVLASVADAFAHTKSETQSVWRIVGSTVHVVYTIPDIEIPRLAHLGGIPLSESELADYVRQNVTVLHAGRLCERTEDVRPIMASAGFKRFEFAYKCADADGMSIHSSGFFSFVPTHV